MSKALINALAIAAFQGGMTNDFTDALAFATKFVEDNADLLAGPGPLVSGGTVTPARPAMPLPKCPNCHQPINDHMPNCARATGVDPRAVTAVHHLRVDGPPPAE